jgi:localization factor PodJL
VKTAASSRMSRAPARAEASVAVRQRNQEAEMNKAVPWSIKGVDVDTREAAKVAARRDGVTLGEWMNRAISDRAAEIGVSAQEFIADERLEAVAEQLARLSRDADTTPRRRRGDSVWREDLTGEGAPRPAGRQRLREKDFSREAAAPEASPAGRRADPEALLEQAIAAFQLQASRVEAGAARAVASVATLIEKAESERSDKLSRLHDRLLDIEAQMQKKEFRGAPPSPNKRRPAAPVRDPLPGAAGDEQFSSLEHRLKTLMERLERPNPRLTAPAPPRRLDDAISAIEARQRVLEASPEPGPKPVRPPLASLIEDGFEALSQKLDRAMDQDAQAAQPSQNPDDDQRFDRLQQGIEGLASRLENLRREFPAVAFHELADRVEAALAGSVADSWAGSSTEPSASPAELDTLRRELAAMGRALADVAPRGAVAGVESAVRELANRVESTRDSLLRAAEARRETASSVEIEALARQVAAMSLTLENVAPRSQLASLESSLRTLGENLERLRNGGLREAVLAPIESLARDLRGELAQVLAQILPENLPEALAKPGASADFDVIASQLRQIEGKLEDLLRAGWADREDFLKVQDKSDELRTSIAAAVEHFAPIARIEQQVAALSDRLEKVAHRAGEASRAQEAGLAAGLAQSAVHWRGVETRLDDLAARIGDAQGETQDMKTPPTLEPLLRALAEKLDLAAAPQPDSGVLEALERQMAQVSEKLSEKLIEQQETRDPPWGTRLERAIEDLASRFEHARHNEHEAAREALREALRGLPEIASLREERKASDVRAQQTLAAVHETLEKVVDRLATLEVDVIEARTGQGERVSRKPAPMASSPFDHDSFLVEPGGGRPDAGRSADAGVPAQTSQQANYIDVARRAIAARAAADQAEEPEAEQRQRAKALQGDALARPMAASAGARRRLPALLAMAGAMLVLGVWQSYRLLSPAAIVTSAVESGQTSSAAVASQDQKSAAKTPSDKTPATQESTKAAQAPVAPVSTDGLTSPKPAAGAGLGTGSGASLGIGQGVDPLAVGSIKPRGIQLAVLMEMANKGDSAAQFDIGSRLIDGRGFARDPAAAIHWFEKAAAQGLAQAQFRLGAIYEKGLGVTRDAARARDCYEQAATAGHVRAMHNLAVMLAEGVEGKPDYAAAAQWFRRAADYGVRDSQYNLAILYARGLGVTQNLGQSFVWFDIAARQGDEDAAKKRDDVSARLDASTIAAVRRQADDFHARTPAAAINDPPSPPTGPAAALIFSPSPIAKAFSRM